MLNKEKKRGDFRCQKHFPGIFEDDSVVIVMSRKLSRHQNCLAIIAGPCTKFLGGCELEQCGRSAWNNWWTLAEILACS